MSEIQEILLPEGRIVAGHPMNANTVTDDAGKPVLGPDGQAKLDYYFGFAIAKQGEADWRQTPWGQQINAAAVSGWPNGEFNAPTFAWKVTDGDSQVPNRKGNKPCDREGWPGHWVLQLKTMIPIRCFHVGKYDPMQQIQDKNEIKCGDYGRAFLTAKANFPSQSPGVYLNPGMFELTRAGQLIVTDNRPDAASVFGGGGAAAPATPPPAAAPATPPPAAAQATPPPAAPDRNFVNPPPATAPERKFSYNGGVYTDVQLRQSGWSDAQINALPPA